MSEHSHGPRPGGWTGPDPGVLGMRISGAREEDLQYFIKDLNKRYTVINMSQIRKKTRTRACYVEITLKLPLP